MQQETGKEKVGRRNRYRGIEEVERERINGSKSILWKI